MEKEDFIPNSDSQTVSEEGPLTETHNFHLGAILGTLLILLVVILGGLYIWGSMLVEEPEHEIAKPEIENNEPETPRAEADVQIFDTMSPSTELDAIEADLESTDLDSLDAEMTEIENELDAALEVN